MFYSRYINTYINIKFNIPNITYGEVYKVDTG